MDGPPAHLRQPRREKRRGFHDKSVGGLSVAVIALGGFSMAMGVVVLVIALLDTCKFRDENYWNSNNGYNHRRPYYDDYYYGTTTTTTTIAPTTTPYYIGHCRYVHSYMSPGIWAGLMFIASGIIGAFASKRKTTCFIVSMMVMALVNAWVAAVSLTVSIWANFDVRYNQVSPMPIALRVANGIVSLCSLLAFILSWVKFGYACRAVCCNGLKGYPKIKERQYQYRPLAAQPMMYAQSQAPVNSSAPAPAPMFHPQPAPAPTNAPEPIYLVQGHQIIGVLPNNPGQPMMANVAALQNPSQAVLPNVAVPQNLAQPMVPPAAVAVSQDPAAAVPMV